MPKSRSRRTPQRRPAQRHQPRQRPAPPVLPQPSATGVRGAVERRSAPVLLWFSQRPKVLLPALSLALLIGGFVAPLPVAVPMLVLLLLVVAWLTYLSWPAVQGGARVVRVATLGLLVVALVSRLAGGGAG